MPKGRAYLIPKVNYLKPTANFEANKEAMLEK